MHPLRSFSKLIQFSLLAETISFSLLHLLIPNGGVLFTPHLLHPACQKSLSSPSSPHFPFDSSFILKVSGREHLGPSSAQRPPPDAPQRHAPAFRCALRCGHPTRAAPRCLPAPGRCHLRPTGSHRGSRPRS